MIMRVIFCAAIILVIILPISATIAIYSSAGHLLMLCEVAFLAGYIIYLLVRTLKMKKVLGVSSEEEFEALKQSCSFRHKDRIFISDQWVINTYSMKAYPLTDITGISTYDSFGTKSGTKFYVKVALSTGRDVFHMSSRSERDRIAAALREYYAYDGSPVVPDETLKLLSEAGAGDILNDALKNINNKNSRNRQ